jgi:hypothetical protein
MIENDIPQVGVKGALSGLSTQYGTCSQEAHAGGDDDDDDYDEFDKLAYIVIFIPGNIGKMLHSFYDIHHACQLYMPAWDFEIS